MNKSMMQAYRWMNDEYIHWDRKDSTHIVVYTNGYKTQQAYDIEAKLMTYKFNAMSMDYDSISGKTWTVYKHR